jgi:hypothetical protein
MSAKFLGVLLCPVSGALPEYPFAEQSAFQASEPTVIRINMDVPRYSNSDLVKLEKSHQSKNFLAKNSNVWPKFNVDYFFGADKKEAHNSMTDILMETQKTNIAAKAMSEHQFLETPSIGKYLRDNAAGEEFVLNLVPPTESHDQAKRSVLAEIEKSTASNFRQIQSFRTKLASLAKPQEQFIETSAAQMSSSVNKLKNRIAYGGQIARNALNSLINLIQFSEAKKAMIASGVLSECATLLKRESTANDLRALAGSVITLLTDMPVASTVDDASTGSYAHVNIVLPSPNRIYHADASLAQIEAGADIAHVA